MCAFDVSGQSLRCRNYQAAVRRFAGPNFNKNGEWIATRLPPPAREWLWAAFAYLAGDAGDIAFASRLVMHAPEPADGYSIFTNTHALHLLVAHGHAFTAEARLRLEAWGRLTIEDSPGGARADLQFHGYNDNMPTKATLGLILGGEYFGDQRAVEQGLWNLHQLRLLLTRRGVISEHCSPTYTPLTLTNLMEIVHYAKSAEARELASACSEHVWAELLAHYHAPTRAVVGPYSRAYATDSAGHLGNLHFLLWQVFGTECVPDPAVELFSRDSPAIIHHRGDHFFVVAGFAFLAACEHRPPQRLLDWLAARTLPFEFRATTERAEGGAACGTPSFTANRVTITSYQAAAFAVGTSNGDWREQSECWHVLYKRTTGTAPAGLVDIRHLTMRYIVDDLLPGVAATSPRGDETGEVDYVSEFARYHTLQKGPVALVAAGPVDDLAGRACHRLSLAIILPEHFSQVDDVRFEEGHFWLEDGPFIMAIKPLGVRRWSLDTPEFSIIRSGAYRLLCLPTYEGEARVFSVEELRASISGFFSISGSLDETTRDDFRSKVLASYVRDTVWMNQRTIHWQGCGHTLELSCGLVARGLRFAAIDGEEPAAPVWEAKGLARESLSLMAAKGRGRPNPYAFPYGPESNGWDAFPCFQFTGDSREPALSTANEGAGAVFEIGRPQ
jgi:hypothetical protein